MINIIIHGCNGKMGQVVASMAASQSDIRIVAGIDRYPDAFENPFPVYSSLDECPVECDVVVDFSLPQALPSLLKWAHTQKCALVIATTGFNEKEQQSIEAYSKEIPIFQAANMSIGINLMYQLIQQAAQVLGDSYDIEIIEKHHNEKVDAPSGTAYALANAINEVFLNSKHYIYGRHSKNDMRSPSDMGIHAIRGGTLVGQHTVMFAGKDEVIEIEHTAYSKQIFAVGALRAVRYMANRRPGLYNMKNVLDERSPVTSITTQADIILVSIRNAPAKLNTIANIFKEFAGENNYLELISQISPADRMTDITFALSAKDLEKAEAFCRGLAAKDKNLAIKMDTDIIKITLEGLGLEQQPRVAATVFELINRHNIPIKASATSNQKIDCFIDKVYEKITMDTLIEGFGL
ncbi:MAG: 4-hydroxy-tetrahydrodipicolinate reductase [Clostridiales bacterium]|jgi:4-hydroxy-tetrahydrodipicolinate reductase|nr:4-hydroxy-tetrahydrodipicolinate reductase [Clostridiales bacterium]